MRSLLRGLGPVLEFLSLCILFSATSGLAWFLIVAVLGGAATDAGPRSNPDYPQQITPAWFLIVTGTIALGLGAVATRAIANLR